MKIYQIRRANEIESRIIALNNMRNVLEDTDKRNVSLIATGQRLDDAVELSSEMRTVLLGMCIGEIAKLDKEFGEL